MEQEELNISPKVTKEAEEIRVSNERITQWAPLITIEEPDTLYREIESVLDLGMKAACSIDRHFSADTVSREKHHATDRAADGVERGHLFTDLSDEVPNASLFSEAGDHRVAR